MDTNDTINQKEYLKKYLAIGKVPGEKKKKKKLKGIANRITIIDDDVESFSNVIEEDPLLASEYAPQIVAIIDERPPSLRVDEKTKNPLWQPIGTTETIDITEQKQIITGFKIASRSNEKPLAHLVDRSPPRKRKEKLKNDEYPPQKKRTVGEDSSSSKHKFEEGNSPRGNWKTDDFSPRKSDDNSPPRKSRNDHNSPPRKSRNGNSPPRKSRKEENIPQKKRKLDDYSPPRKSKYVDYSLSRKTRSLNNSPRKSRNDGYSPPRKMKNYDFSPPQMQRNDNSSSNRRTKNNNSSSPKRRPRSDTDDSPFGKARNLPAKHSKNEFSPPGKPRSDISSPRTIKTRDHSPPKKQRSKLEDKDSKKYKHGDDSTSNPGKMEKTLDGKAAGLQNAEQLAEETKQFRSHEDQLFKNLSQDVSGENADTVFRDRKSGKIRNLAEEEERQQKRREEEEKNKEKYSRWGKGLVQVESRDQKIKEDLYEMSKPLARYADDEDLEKFLKEQEREGDPMLAYIRSKKRKEAAKAGVVVKPEFEGQFMPNRFGIKPGHRWDGVDRSNGYEKRWFEVQNAKRAQQEDIYKWSTEEM